MDTKVNNIPPELDQQEKAVIPSKGNVVCIDAAPTIPCIMSRLMQIKAKLDAFDENPLRFKNTVKCSTT